MKKFRVVSSVWHTDAFNSEKIYSVMADYYQIHYDDNVVVLSFYKQEDTGPVKAALIASFVNFDYVSQVDEEGYLYVVKEND